MWGKMVETRGNKIRQDEVYTEERNARRQWRQALALLLHIAASAAQRGRGATLTSGAELTTSVCALKEGQRNGTEEHGESLDRFAHTWFSEVSRFRSVLAVLTCVLGTLVWS